MGIQIDLSNKLAVITGGTRGIGHAIAKEFKKAGASVIITGRSTEFSSRDDLHYHAVDFLCQDSTQDFIVFLAKSAPDILVNNAGINKIDDFANISREDFINIQRVNVEVPFLLCQTVISEMKMKGWGRIVNISSIFGKISKARRGAYSTSKFALDGMTAALAAEVAADGILANCVAPGFIDTELTQKILGVGQMQELAKQIPIGRLGRAEEIAKMVVWLSSEENTYLSGQNITIDGGFSRV